MREYQELLVSLLAGFLQTTIIIDAFDECEPKTRRELFDVLQAALPKDGSSGGPIKILITSREDGDLADIYKQLLKIDIRSGLVDITSDISLYINSELEAGIRKGRCK